MAGMNCFSREGSRRNTKPGGRLKNVERRTGNWDTENLAGMGFNHGWDGIDAELDEDRLSADSRGCSQIT